MNCQQVNKLLERYDEGDLPSQISTQVETHLQSCTNCQTKLRLVEKERICLQSSIDIPPLESDFAQNIIARIAVSTPPVLPALVPIWVEWIRRYPTLLGAAAVILLFIFPVFGQPYRNPELLPTANSVKQVATLDKAQNVPYNSALTEQQPLASPNNNYYNEERLVTRDGPSRSGQTQPLTGALGPSAPTMKTLAAPDEVTTDGQSLAPAVVPSYIPDGYILDKIETGDNNRVTISYLTNNSNDHSGAPLVITIAPTIPRPAADTRAATANQEEELVLEQKTLAAPSAPSDEDLTEFQGICGAYNYLITSNTPIKKKEMDNLLNSLIPQPSE